MSETRTAGPGWDTGPLRPEPRRYPGKYRGRVEGNTDPKSLGRLQVSAPAVLGDGTQSWAMPSVPYAGPGVGWFALPPVGANVWVEFEGGDPDYPIWSGCFWNDGDIPADPATEAFKVLQTGSIRLELNDTQDSGGLTLTVGEPGVSTEVKLVIDSQGVQLTDDKSVITIKPEEISIKNEEVEVRISSSEIELKQGDVTGKLTGSEMELKNGSVKVKLEGSALSLETGTPSIKLSGSGVELSNGGSKVELTASSVSVNNGALEVM